MFHERKKHIDVRYHFVCEIIARGDIVVVTPHPKRVYGTCNRRVAYVHQGLP